MKEALHSPKYKVAMVCKLMPYYRLGIFQALSAYRGDFEFNFFGDTKEQAGIKQISFTYASQLNPGKKIEEGKINWKRTKNFFYKPERLLWQTDIVSQIFSKEYDVFVFEGAIAHLPLWLFAPMCKLRGKKVLFWTHGDRGLDQGIKKFLRRLLFKWLGDGLLLYGERQKANMMKDGYRTDELHVIYNSLQPQKQFELLKEFEQGLIPFTKKDHFKNPSLFTILFIGRLTQQKEVIEVLKALHTLKIKGTQINCYMIGKGPEYASLKAYCTDNKIHDQVHFTGALYEEKELTPYFATSDLMMSPGNVGLNCIHSLAYGVPVLTHDNFAYQNPEVEAITPYETGMFYKHKDYDDLVEKLTDWIETSILKTEIKSKCQQVIKTTYNPLYQAKQIVKSLNKLTNNG